MLQRLYPHLGALGLFTLLTILYFLPYYQGKTLNQHDISQWNAIAKETIDFREKTGEEPLWSGRIFGGMPAFQISTIYPNNWLNYFNKTLQILFPEAVSAFFLMLAGFYILLISLEAIPLVAAVGAIAYAFGSFNLISMEAGHNTKVMNMALMAPMLAGVITCYKNNTLPGAALTAFSTGLAILSGHFQIVYYTGLILLFTALYFLIESILKKEIAAFIKNSMVLLIAAGIGLLPNVANLWSNFDYAKETIRGGGSELSRKKAATDGGLDFDYASRWSYGATDLEWFSLWIPNIKGGASGGALSSSSEMYKEISSRMGETEAERIVQQMPVYWGTQPFTSGPVYIGAIILFLFLLGLWILPGNLRFLLLGLTIFSLLLSFGHHTPFFGWLFNSLPFFNKFRTPSMALVIAGLAMPLLAFLSLNYLLQAKLSWTDIAKKFIPAFYTALGLCALGLLAVWMWFDFSGPNDVQYREQLGDLLMAALRKDRASLLQQDAFRSLMLISLAGLSLWAFLKNKLTQKMLILSLGLLVTFDMWSVAKRYLNTNDFVDKSTYEANFSPSEADLDILKDTDPSYRVLDATVDLFNNAYPAYYHRLVGGYHPAKLIRYQDLIENQISKNNMSVLNMLNTRYVIQQLEDGRKIAQRNPGALGAAWIPKQIQWVKNADEEMEALSSFSPKETTIIDERFRNQLNTISSSDSAGFITLKQYEPNHLVYQFSSSKSELVVFSEIYYPRGWNLYIDGKPADYLRANYVLRAAAVPSGSHQLEWKFEPTPYLMGEKVDLAGSILLCLFVFSVIGVEAGKWRKEQQLSAQVKTEKKKG